MSLFRLPTDPTIYAVFPQELIDKVIESLDPTELQTFRSCSLVAKSWTHSSSAMLFHSVSGPGFIIIVLFGDHYVNWFTELHEIVVFKSIDRPTIQSSSSPHICAPAISSTLKLDGGNCHILCVMLQRATRTVRSFTAARVTR